VIDIENTLRNTLHADAEQVPVPADLGGRAVVRAVRIRRRRRVAAASGAAVAVLAALLAVPLLRADQPPPHQAVAPLGAELHFDIDETAAGAKVDYVYQGPDLEMVSMSSGRSRMVVDVYLGAAPDDLVQSAHEDKAGRGHWVAFARNGPREPVTVAGRAGTIERWTDNPGHHGWLLRWPIGDGRWGVAISFGARRNDPIAAAQALRPEGTRECRVPFRVSFVPAGYRNVSCGLWFSWYPPGDVTSTVVWRKGTSDVTVEARFGPGQTIVPNFTINGRPALWSRVPRSLAPSSGTVVPGPVGHQDSLIVPELHGYRVAIEGTTQRDAVRMAESMTFATEPAKPETWPR
jgi:hypothetical protein